MADNFIKGRGAQQNAPNAFLQFTSEWRDDFLEYCLKEGELADGNKTTYHPVSPKSIVNKVTSPDVGMAYSMNPYQGCEHGCIYCYARNTHEYWGYSAGLDFERKILIKENAPQLLEAKLKSKNWVPKTIVLSGNTDCYQPAEKHYKITRACLEVFLEYKHPVGIITKNSLLLRDLDLLQELNKFGLIGVNISVTTLCEKTRRLLEPRTTTIAKRLETIKILSAHHIPVNAMLAPMIPGINSHELLKLARTTADCGALSFAYTVVRLNGPVGQLFTDWIQRTMPDKAEKVLNQIAHCHGGSLHDSRIGIRGRGEGKLAQQLQEMARIARQHYYRHREFPKLNTTLFNTAKERQLKLF